MKKKMIRFSPPDISELEIEEVSDTLRSGWITTGPRTKDLEKRLARYINTEKVVCLNSATAAEELNLRILGIKPGDEVIIPAYTYTASASAAIHAGASVKLIDIQNGHWEMDYGKLSDAITDKTKAIITVDLGGIPCDYGRVFQIVEEKKSVFKPESVIQDSLGRVAVISDAAHALGASYKGKMVGSIADFTSFSFHAVKNLTTAEGGASAWRNFPQVNNDELYQLFQKYSLHGQSKDALAKTKLGAWEYDIVAPWYKCNMTDIMAAIGLKQLDRYQGMLDRRKEIIKRYDDVCDKIGVKHLDHYNDEHISSGHLYITRIPEIGIEKRNEIITSMAEAGISCNVHYKPLPLFTAYKDLGFDIYDFQNAFKFYENEVTLPLHTMLSDEDVDYICECFEKIIKGDNPVFTDEKTDFYPIEGNIIEPFKQKIWLSSPTMHGDEQRWVDKAIRTNWVSTVGENINDIEERIAVKVGVKHSVAVSSGTAALHLAIKLAGERIYGQAKPHEGTLTGKKVFCSDMTFDASVNPVAYEGGEAVFIDTEYDTWNMDPKALEKAFEIYPDTRIIVVAHLYGSPGKMQEIRHIADAHNALIVEDAAESLGAKCKLNDEWIETGAIGDYNCISFNGNKIITGSSGGMFLTNSEEDADKVRKWSTQSRENAPWYQHEEIGYNYRMSNIVAGIVRGQLPYLDEHISRKKVIWERYRNGFSNLPVRMNPWDEKNSIPNFWMSCLLIDNDAMARTICGEREYLYEHEQGKSSPMEILDSLSAINAEGRPIWKPMHMQPLYRMNPFISADGNARGRSNAYNIKGDNTAVDVGSDIFRRGLCLPSDNKMEEWQQDIIIETIKGCFGRFT